MSMTIEMLTLRIEQLETQLASLQKLREKQEPTKKQEKDKKKTKKTSSKDEVFKDEVFHAPGEVFWERFAEHLGYTLDDWGDFEDNSRRYLKNGKYIKFYRITQLDDELEHLDVVYKIFDP